MGRKSIGFIPSYSPIDYSILILAVGIVGMVLAVPLFAIVKIVWRTSKRQDQSNCYLRGTSLKKHGKMLLEMVTYQLEVSQTYRITKETGSLRQK